ncbi:hypothetical protein H0H92_005670, partial [Tricholoma furcatifolium]
MAASSPSSVHVRLQNSWFLTYPWSSSTVVEDEDFEIFRRTMMWPLASRIQSAEQLAMQTPCVEDIYTIFRCKALSIKTAVVGPKRMQEATFKILLAYRLLDVYAVRYMLERRNLHETSTFNGVFAHHNRIPLSKLNDLGYLLSSFKRKFNTLSKSLTTRVAPTAATANKRPFDGSGLEVQSLNTPSASSRTVDQAIVISSPTEHLLVPQPSYALSPTMRLYSDLAKRSSGLLDTSNPEAVKAHILKNGSEADLVEYAYLNSLDAEIIQTVTLMHNVLYVALLVSPLLLLLPKMYKDIGRKEHIVNIWKDLGKMRKPREFIQAENQVWDIIFSVAEGADLMTELSQLETDVDVSPWLQVERDPDDFHKSTDPTIPSDATSASTDIGTRSLDLASIPRPILESIIAAIRSTSPMSRDCEPERLQGEHFGNSVSNGVVGGSILSPHIPDSISNPVAEPLAASLRTMSIDTNTDVHLLALPSYASPQLHDTDSGPNPRSVPYAVAASVDHHASPDIVVLPTAPVVDILTLNSPSVEDEECSVRPSTIIQASVSATSSAKLISPSITPPSDAVSRCGMTEPSSTSVIGFADALNAAFENNDRQPNVGNGAQDVPMSDVDDDIGHASPFATRSAELILPSTTTTPLSESVLQHDMDTMEPDSTAATVTGFVDALNAAFETNNRPQVGIESQDVPMHNADDDSDLTELSSEEEEQNRYSAPTILGGEDADDEQDGLAGLDHLRRSSRKPKQHSRQMPELHTTSHERRSQRGSAVFPIDIDQFQVDGNLSDLKSKKISSRRPRPPPIVIEDSDDEIIILRHIPGLNGTKKNPAVLHDLTLEVTDEEHANDVRNLNLSMGIKYHKGPTYQLKYTGSNRDLAFDLQFH